jgi:anti-sigma factor RsiW
MTSSSDRIRRASARRDLAAAAMPFVGIIYGWLADQVLQTIAPHPLRRDGHHAE